MVSGEWGVVSGEWGVVSGHICMSSGSSTLCVNCECTSNLDLYCIHIHTLSLPPSLSTHHTHPHTHTHTHTHTMQYVPNEYALQMSVDFPNLFVPFGSVNPYRSDALEELERCAQYGVKVIKWLVRGRSQY